MATDEHGLTRIKPKSLLFGFCLSVLIRVHPLPNGFVLIGGARCGEGSFRRDGQAADHPRHDSRLLLAGGRATGGCAADYNVLGLKSTARSYLNAPAHDISCAGVKAGGLADKAWLGLKPDRIAR